MTGITIYGKQDCPACAEAKAFFAGKSVPVTEVDIDQAPKSVFDLFLKDEAVAIPVITVCKESSCKTFKGFSPSEMEKEL